MSDDWLPAEVKPPAPGIYPVLALTYDAQGELLSVDERFARWTGSWWCCWATNPQRAARCEFRGPMAGYRWRRAVSQDAAVIDALQAALLREAA